MGGACANTPDGASTATKLLTAADTKTRRIRLRLPYRVQCAAQGTRTTCTRSTATRPGTRSTLVRSLHNGSNETASPLETPGRSSRGKTLEYAAPAYNAEQKKNCGAEENVGLGCCNAAPGEGTDVRHSDVVIVGGGIIGSSIAYHLALRAVAVVVVDIGEPAAPPSASWASAGGVRQQARDPREWPLTLEASRRWPALERELGATFDFRQAAICTWSSATTTFPRSRRGLRGNAWPDWMSASSMRRRSARSHPASRRKRGSGPTVRVTARRILRRRHARLPRRRWRAACATARGRDPSGCGEPAMSSGRSWSMASRSAGGGSCSRPAHGVPESPAQSGSSFRSRPARPRCCSPIPAPPRWRPRLAGRDGGSR